MRAVIFDLDNCLADDQWRLQYIDWKEEDPIRRYSGYHARCSHDSVGNKNVFAEWVVKSDFVIFLTGRPERVRRNTMDWIEKNLGEGLCFRYEVAMRRDNDGRPSVEIKREYVQKMERDCRAKVVMAFDDRSDILEMYSKAGLPSSLLKIHDGDAYDQKPVATGTNAADVLQTMATTFREKNAVYRDNYKKAAAILEILFPGGNMKDHEIGHLVSLIVVKLTRFAADEMKHRDSMLDTGVYAAMIVSILDSRKG